MRTSVDRHILFQEYRNKVVDFKLNPVATETHFIHSQMTDENKNNNYWELDRNLTLSQPKNQKLISQFFDIHHHYQKQSDQTHNVCSVF